MPTLTKLYGMQEVAERNSKYDFWVVIDGKVYDVSSYLDEHPGGDDVLIAAIRKDAKEEFEDAGHSLDARDLMESFCVGELDPSPATITEPKVAAKPSKKKKQDDDVIKKTKNLPLQCWALPVAIVGISLVVSALYSRKK